MVKLIFTFLFLALFSPRAALGASHLVRAWAGESVYDMRFGYLNAVLSLALKKNESELGPVELKLVSGAAVELTQERALQQMASGKIIDVVPSMTTAARERTLLPVRFDLFDGLLGFRVFLSKDSSSLAHVISDSQMKIIPIGVGADWPDREIMDKNGYQTMPISSYNSLFELVRVGRIPVVSRAFPEPWNEIRAFGADTLAVDRSVALFYPAPIYFFVRPGNEALASRIASGLAVAQADGSLKALQRKYFERYFESLPPGSLRIFQLNNPLLSNTPPDGFKSWKEFGAVTLARIRAWRPPEERSSPTPSARAIAPVRIRGAESELDFRLLFHKLLARMALNATSKEYGATSLQEAPFYVARTQTEAFERLRDGKIDIVGSAATKERLAQFDAVPFPLTHGLIGNRLLVVRAADQEMFSDVRNVNALNRYRICVGKDWPDRIIMERAGLTLFLVSNVAEGYKALLGGQCDAFTRAVYEAEDELRNQGNASLVLDRYILLKYPLVQNFFVRKGNMELAERLQMGLQRCLADGSYSRVFSRFYADLVATARLSERRVLEIPNEDYPPSLPRPQSEAWIWFLSHGAGDP